MRIPRGVLPLLMLFGCAGLPAEPPPAVAPDPVPPSVTLAPRAEWRRIPMDQRGGIAAAYAASSTADWGKGLRRVWIVLNLADPIRLPETGGQARSVAFLADYRCATQSWSPIEGAWYRRADAEEQEYVEAPRQSEERGVQPGTLVAVFLEAACRS